MKAHIFLTKSYILIFLILFFSLTTHPERTNAETVSWQSEGALCAFENPSRKVQAAALRKLIDLNYMEKFPIDKIEGITNLLSYPDSEVRVAAVNALEVMDKDAVAQKPNIVKKLINMLEDEDKDVRIAVINALGKMKMAAAQNAANIAKLLDDKRDYVRFDALRALGAIGKAAASQTARIKQLLEDENENKDVRSAAESVLIIMDDVAHGKDIIIIWKNDGEGIISQFSATQQPSEIVKGLNSRNNETLLSTLRNVQALGPDAATHAPTIANLLKNPNSDVQRAALNCLGSMGDAADEQAPKIIERLKTGDFLVPIAAVNALGNMKRQAPLVARLLEDENQVVVFYALMTLKKMGKAAAEQAVEISKYLDNTNPELRVKAVEAIGAMQEAGAEYAPKIAKLLIGEDREIRLAALEALGAMGKAAGEDAYAETRRLLVDDNWKIRLKALTALGAMGGSSLDIANMLADGDEDVRDAAVEVLESKGGLKQKRDILLILNGQYKIPQFADTLTFYAYYFAGGDKKINTLVKWLTMDPRQTRPSLEGPEIEIFLDAWDPEILHYEVLEKLANCISYLTREVKWKKSDQKTLENAEKKLRGLNFDDQADVVKHKLEEIERNQVLIKYGVNLLGVVGVHVLFWLTLINLYPRSLGVQSFFFWTPWARRLFGFGYVGIILSNIPYFRTKLFAPFKDSLISSAALDAFDEQTYFDKSNVRDGASGQIQPIKEAITEIKNQIYLEGESGLGKTMFLGYLIRHSGRTVIYLRADYCSKGVIEAIQSKLHGPAKDPKYLKSLIYTGAFDICIDGLNEVSPDTRAHITEFVHNFPKANIIIASQPLEWIPPSTLKTYILQPLEEKQIETFLLTRKHSLPPDASVTGKDFEQACMNYLSDILNDELPMDRIDSAKRVLSNPIDLTLVALMLAYGEYPDLFHLMEQQYDLMNNDYKRLYNSDFPLTAFSETVFQMRLDDKIALYQKEYLNEIKSMEKHKMVLGRSIRDAQEKISTQWYFRHDKIMDYFIMFTFLGPNNIRLVKYIDDPRFRGVYFLLAMLMPWEEAEALRERLILYSATSKDHTVSDTFVQLLISRKAA